MTTNDTTIARLLEQLIAEGPQAMREVTTTLMNVAMSLEREQSGDEARHEANKYNPNNVH